MFVGIIGKNAQHIYLVIGKYNFDKFSESEHYIVIGMKDVTKVATSDVCSMSFACGISCGKDVS